MKIDKEVKIAFWISLGALVLVFLSTLFIYGYKADFIRNIFVEAHGMVFDLLIIATFLFFLQTRVRKKRTREQNIKRWKEENSDFRGWDEKEATFRIVGNIRRLNRQGVTKINLTGCFLNKADLNEVKITNSNAHLAFFREANLSNAKIINYNLRLSDFTGANLVMADLRETKLKQVNFEKAMLMGANLRETDFEQTILEETNFQGADLRGAKKLTIGQLSRVKTLYNAKLDPDLQKKIEDKFPHLLEEPEYFKLYKRNNEA